MDQGRAVRAGFACPGHRRQRIVIGVDQRRGVLRGGGRLGDDGNKWHANGVGDVGDENWTWSSAHLADRGERLLADTVEAEGQRVVCWREIELDLGHVGETSSSVAPLVKQLVVAASGLALGSQLGM